MGTYEDIQNQTTEQSLREELQLVKKENEELATQVRALLAQLQNCQQYSNLPPGSSPHGPGLEPGSTSNEPAPAPPQQPQRASQETHQYVMQPPPVNAPINLTIPVAPTTLEALPRGTRDLSSGNPDPALLPDVGAALARCELPGRLYGEPPELA
jgi:hypothetical protein